MTVEGLQLILVVFVRVMFVGTVPDTAGVKRPAASIYAKSSNTKPNEKSENIVQTSCLIGLIGS